jgi:hypothetical protein
MTSQADLDRTATSRNAELTASLASPKTSRLIRRAQVREFRDSIKAIAATVTTAARTGTTRIEIPTRPRFLATTVTKDRLEQIEWMIRELATKHRDCSGMSLEDLGSYFHVRPRSIEAMLRRNADYHTLRIYQKRVKLSTQETLDLIDRQRRPSPVPACST